MKNIHFDNKTMKPGDVLEEFGGDVYVYLGDYMNPNKTTAEGKPYCAHLYVNLGRFSFQEKQNPIFWQEAPTKLSEAISNYTLKEKGSYRVTYKTFVKRLYTIDIELFTNKLQTVWGLQKV